MSTNPHASSLELALRLGAQALVCEVVSSQRLSSSLREVVLSGPPSLCGVPGNDVMIQVPNAEGRLVRRRYSVRSTDASRDEFTLWVTTEHDGAGSDWARSALAGQPLDVIGPRGKIVLDEMADWHVFVGDASGLASFYRLAQSIEVPGRAIFIVEIDAPDDALTAPFDEGLGVTGIFVDRHERAHDDPAGLLNGLAAFDLPPDIGHAYLFGEFSIIKVVADALLDRGMTTEQISRKAYWRAGRVNADHGEPDKSDA
jgi:NADPH-dependent ferric siderophore reductase